MNFFVILAIIGFAAANTMIGTDQNLAPFCLQEWLPQPTGDDDLPIQGLWIWAHAHSIDGTNLDWNILIANSVGSYFSLAWNDVDMCTPAQYAASYNGPMTVTINNQFYRNVSASDNGATFNFAIYANGDLTLEDTLGGFDLASSAGGCRFQYTTEFEDPVDNILYRSRIGDLTGTVHGHPVEGIFGIDGYWGNAPWLLTPTFYVYEKEWVVFYDKLENGRVRYGTTVWGPDPFKLGYVIEGRHGDRHHCQRGTLLEEDRITLTPATATCGIPSALVMGSDIDMRAYLPTFHVADLPVRPDIGLTLQQINAVHRPAVNSNTLVSYAWWEHVHFA